jgi:hypothetical protein
VAASLTVMARSPLYVLPSCQYMEIANRVIPSDLRAILLDNRGVVEVGLGCAIPERIELHSDGGLTWVPVLPRDGHNVGGCRDDAYLEIGQAFPDIFVSLQGDSSDIDNNTLLALGSVGKTAGNVCAISYDSLIVSTQSQRSIPWLIGNLVAPEE